MLNRTATGHMSLLRLFSLGLTLAGLLFAVSPTVKAAEATDEKQLVERARLTLESFMTDGKMAYVREHLKDAKGVLIVPQLFKAGFMVGGSGGSGVLLAKDDKTGEWSPPAFYTLDGGSMSRGTDEQAAGNDTTSGNRRYIGRLNAHMKFPIFLFISAP